MKNVILINSDEFDGVDLLKVIDFLVFLGFNVKVRYKEGFEEDYDEWGLVV